MQWQRSRYLAPQFAPQFAPQILLPARELILPASQRSYVGFAGAGALPVPLYGSAATLPLTLGGAPRPWNFEGMPWSALFVPGILDKRRLALFCELLTQLDEIWLRDFPQTPNLYQSGVRYELMPQTEYWLEVPWALAFARAGHGVDCKTLAAWRAAELRVREGQPGARCVLSEYKSDTEHVYHVRVERQDGTIEDPSARLGMSSVMPTSGGSLYQGAR